MFWNAYLGARPRVCGILNEADSNIGVEDGVDLFERTGSVGRGAIESAVFMVGL